MYRLRAATQLLFSPSFLAPFLFASLALAVLGSSCYQILYELLDKRNINHIALSLATYSLIFLGVMVLIIVLTIKRKEKQEYLGNKPSPEKRQRLILLVSRLEPAQKAIRHHQGTLKECYLICSEQTKPLTRDLQQEFSGICDNPPIEISDINNPLETYKKVENILKIMTPEQLAETICDYTGMTAHTSIGMFWASRKYRTKIQYTPAKYENGKAVGSLEPIEIIVEE